MLVVGTFLPSSRQDDKDISGNGISAKTDAFDLPSISRNMISRTTRISQKRSQRRALFPGRALWYPQQWLINSKDMKFTRQTHPSSSFEGKTGRVYTTVALKKGPTE